jgi:hypothetical protein
MRGQLHVGSAACGVQISHETPPVTAVARVPDQLRICGSGAEVAAPLASGGDPPPSWAVAVGAGSVLLPVWFPSMDSATSIAHRSVLLRCILEVWGAESDLDRCVAAVAANRAAVDGAQMEPASGVGAAAEGESFRITFSSVGCKIPKQQQQAAIRQLAPASRMTGQVFACRPVHWRPR